MEAQMSTDVLATDQAPRAMLDKFVHATIIPSPAKAKATKAAAVEVKDCDITP